MTEVPLGEALELIIDHRGKTPKKLGGDFTDSGVPVVSAIHIKDGVIQWSERERYVSPQMFAKWMPQRLQKGDVLLTSEAPLGQTALVPSDDDLVLSQRLFALRGKKGVLDSAYLRYFLASEVGQRRLHDRATGTTVVGIRQSELLKVLIPLPAIDEQRRIAGVLGALDDLIDVNRRLIADAAELISALFGKLMKTAALGDMPLFDVFDVDFGGAYKGDHFSSPGLGMPLLRIRDLKTQKSDTWTTERIKGDVVVSAGDVLIGMDAEFRPTYWLGADSLLNQRVCRVRPKSGSLAFARESLVKPMAFIEGHKTGTTVSHLNKADLTETRIAMPDSQSLSQFDAAADPLRLAIVDLHREILELSAARDDLLPLLMSGRVRAGDVAA